MFLEKMALISLFNLGGLTYLIWRLMKRGTRRPDAFRIAWKMVIGGRAESSASPEIQPLWTIILPMTWWVMNLCYIVAWVVTSEMDLAMAFVLVAVFHLAWYLLSIKGKEEYNRFIRFNQQFGVIFKEIACDSELSGKSLAELDLRKKELLVLAVERAGRITPFPKGLEVLEIGDRLVIFGDMNSFRTIFGYL